MLFELKKRNFTLEEIDTFTVLDLDILEGFILSEKAAEIEKLDYSYYSIIGSKSKKGKKYYDKAAEISKSFLKPLSERYFIMQQPKTGNMGKFLGVPVASRENYEIYISEKIKDFKWLQSPQEQSQ